MDTNKKNTVSQLEKFNSKQKFMKELKANKNVFEYMYNIYSYDDDDKRDASIEYIYDVLIKYIQDPDTIKKVRTALNYFNKYVDGEKLYHRVLLSAYIITIVPEFVLNVRRSVIHKYNSIEKEIFVLAEKVVTNIHIVCCGNPVNTFDEDIKMYMSYFKIFIRLDKDKKINEFINHWCDTKEAITQIHASEKYSKEQKDDALNVVKKTLRKIEANIKRLDKNYDLSKLPSFYELKNKVEHNMKLAFFNKLEEELRNDKYDFLNKLLKEIHDQLVMLHTNSPRKQEIFEENFDIKFIKEMIGNKVFGPDEFISYSSYLVDTINSLQAQIKVNDTKKIWNEMLEKITSNEIGGFDKVVPYVFRFIYKEINTIKDDIIACNTMMNMGLNIFNL